MESVQEHATDLAEMLWNLSGPHRIQSSLRGCKGNEFGCEGGRDPGAGDPGHDFPPASNHRQWEPVGDCLSHHDQVRTYAIPFAGPTDLDTADRFDLIDDEERTDPLGLRPQNREPLRIGLPKYYRLEHHGRQIIAHTGDHLTGGSRVIEGDLGIECASRARHTLGRLAPVEPAVVPTADYPLAPGGDPRQPY